MELCRLTFSYMSFTVWLLHHIFASIHAVPLAQVKLQTINPYAVASQFYNCDLTPVLKLCSRMILLQVLCNED
jgi:hypothetical protein